jgi:pSer/pThr/pTyr-binding forkhead associated (FHA) protein
MAKIHVKFNSAVVKEVELVKEVTTFGRKTENDIVIDNPAISGFHGKILIENDQYFVEDLNSTNGTFMNGQRIKKSLLKNRDQVSIARHVLELITDSSAPTLSEKLSDISSQQITAEEPNVSPPPAPKPIVINMKDLVKPAVKAEISIEPVKPAFAEPVSADNNMLNPDQTPKAGILKIIHGGDGQEEINLKDLVTYIGSSDKAMVKLKGLLAPAIAAAISKKQEGFFLKAAKPGYIKVNGHPLEEQIFLEHGAQIEVGGLTILFHDPHYKPKTPAQTPAAPTPKAQEESAEKGGLL